MAKKNKRLSDNPIMKVTSAKGEEKPFPEIMKKPAK
jgi:hypothetical protein